MKRKRDERIEKGKGGNRRRKEVRNGKKRRRGRTCAGNGLQKPRRPFT